MTIMEPFIRRLPLNVVINIYACSGNQSILHVLFYNLFGPGPFLNSSKYGICDVCYGWKKCAAKKSYNSLEINDCKRTQIGRYMYIIRLAKSYMDENDTITLAYKCCSRICANVLLYKSQTTTMLLYPVNRYYLIKNYGIVRNPKMHEYIWEEDEMS